MADDEPLSSFHQLMKLRQQDATTTKRKIVDVELKEIQNTANISEEEFAAMLGISPDSLDDIQKCGQISLQALKQTIECLGGSLEINARFEFGDLRLCQFASLSSLTGEERR